MASTQVMKYFFKNQSRALITCQGKGNNGIFRDVLQHKISVDDSYQSPESRLSQSTNYSHGASSRQPVSSQWEATARDCWYWGHSTMKACVMSQAVQNDRKSANHRLENRNRTCYSRRWPKKSRPLGTRMPQTQHRACVTRQHTLSPYFYWPAVKYCRGMWMVQLLQRLLKQTQPQYNQPRRNHKAVNRTGWFSRCDLAKYKTHVRS